MTKLWKKTESTLHPAVEKYTVATDPVFDMQLMPFDILVCKAHAKGLKNVGILTTEESNQIQDTLKLLEKDFAEGKIQIATADEDSHTVIENYLVEKLGDTGKKIHTGRSRNEVTVAMRLYMKSSLNTLQNESIELADVFLKMAEKYEQVPMPGYSHTQQAMLSSLGHYFSAFTESLLDDADFISAVEKQINKNPLGSAAGFGVSIPIDRELTT